MKQSEAQLKAEAERDMLRKLDTQAAIHVETVIIMRTRFSGDGKYVGWKGLGLALSEALDERDRLRDVLKGAFWTIDEAYAAIDATNRGQHAAAGRSFSAVQAWKAEARAALKGGSE